MNTNTKYVCFIWYKQASGNMFKKILLETLKILCKKVKCSKVYFQFNIFTGTFEGFCLNSLELLLR